MKLFSVYNVGSSQTLYVVAPTFSGVLKALQEAGVGEKMKVSTPFTGHNDGSIKISLVAKDILLSSDEPTVKTDSPTRRPRKAKRRSKVRHRVGVPGVEISRLIRRLLHNANYTVHELARHAMNEYPGHYKNMHSCKNVIRAVLIQRKSVNGWGVVGTAKINDDRCKRYLSPATEQVWGFLSRN